MIRKWQLAVMALAVTVLLTACSSQAAAPKELPKGFTELKVGDAAPDWSGIIGVDDEKHSLSDYRKAEIIVLVFTCNHCPVAQLYEDRLIALQEEYKGKGVQVVAVNSNDPLAFEPEKPGEEPPDSFEKMKDRAAGKDLGEWRKSKKPFNFPYVFDATQKMALDHGATNTPHVFVFDKDRKVAYIGAIDDNNNAEQAKEHYLQDALNALLAGKEVNTTTTSPGRGCTIKWKKELLTD